MPQRIGPMGACAARLLQRLVWQQPHELAAPPVASRGEPVRAAPATQLVGLGRPRLLQGLGEEPGGLVWLLQIEARGRRPPEQALSGELVPRTSEASRRPARIECDSSR